MKRKEYLYLLFAVFIVSVLIVLGFVVFCKRYHAFTDVNSKSSVASSETRQNSQHSIAETAASSQDMGISVSDRANNVEYGIVNNQLIRDADTDHPVILDLRAAGLVPVTCTLDDVGIYLVTDSKVLFQEGCGEMGGTLWTYDIPTNTVTQNKVWYAFGTEDPSPNLRYQVILGPSDADGEIRTLLVKDFLNDVEFTAGKLDQSFSYRQGISEFDGRPIGSVSWVSNEYAYADVFDARTSLSLFDSRQSVLRKYVNIHPSE